MNDSVNGTTEEPPEEMPWFEFPSWRWAFSKIIIWLMPTLMVFGIVFNVLCFITILRSSKTFPKISRRTMLIITSCDAIVLSIGGFNCYQIYLLRTMNYKVSPFMKFMNDSPAGCHIVNYLYKYMLNGAPYFHVGLTIERVLAVIMPLKVKRIMTGRNHCIMLIVLFLLGSVDSALWSAMQEYIDGDCQSRTNKYVLKTLDKLQYSIEFYVSKTALFSILLTGCIIVAVSLRLQTRKVSRLTNNSTNLKRNKMVGACAAMIFMNLMFFVTHAPRAALSVYEGYSQTLWPNNRLTESQFDLGYQIAEGIMYLHNIVDPLSYFIGRSFRTAFRQVIGGALCLATAGLCGRRRKTSRKETSGINMATSVSTAYNIGTVG